MTSQGRDGADRIPVAWVVTLYDALLSRGDVADRDQAMRRWCDDDPAVALTWFAGVEFAVMGTLPDADPWTSLSARYDGSTTRGRDAPPAVGARSEGRAFGTAEDGRDLAWGGEDTTEDVYLSALGEPLAPAACAVLAFARDGWRPARAALAAVGVGNLYDVGANALRWAWWRRRCYVPSDDPHLLTQARLWIDRARAEESSRQWDVQAAEREILAVNRIPERAYAELAPAPRFGIDAVRSMIERTRGEAAPD